MRIRLLVTVLLLSWAAGATTPREVPDPRPLQRIHDTAALFREGRKEQLEQSLEAASKSSGLDLCMVTVRDAGGLRPMEFGAEIFREFHLARPDQRKRVVVLVFVDDRQLVVVAASGAEKAVAGLPGARASRELAAGRVEDEVVDEVALLESQVSPAASATPVAAPSAEPQAERPAASPWAAALIGAFCLLVLGRILVRNAEGGGRSAPRSKAVGGGCRQPLQLFTAGVVGLILGPFLAAVPLLGLAAIGQSELGRSGLVQAAAPYLGGLSFAFGFAVTGAVGWFGMGFALDYSHHLTGASAPGSDDDEDTQVRRTR